MGWDKAKAIVTVAILASGVAAPPAVVRAGDAAQDKAIAAIEAIGGRVGRVDPVTNVLLSGTPISDAGLAHLAGLKALHSLDLGGAKISDAGLAHLAGLKALRWLPLFGTGVTDAGVEQHRKSMPKVRINRF